MATHYTERYAFGRHSAAVTGTGVSESATAPSPAANTDPARTPILATDAYGLPPNA